MAKIKYKDSEGNIKTLNNIKINYAKSEDEWQPEPDWWDIDKILEEDEENYPAKMIVLLRDNEEITSIERFNASKIKTSDNIEYGTSSTKYSHAWNISKDKTCNLGYKTRYIIWYFSSTNFDGYSKFAPPSILYAIMKNFVVTSPFNSLSKLYLCEAIKCINTEFKGQFLFFNGNFNMQKLTGLKLTNQKMLEGSGAGAFQSCYNLKELELKVDFDKPRSLRNTFNGCNRLNIIDLEKMGINTRLVDIYWNCFPTSCKFIKEINFDNIATSSTNNWVYTFTGLWSLVEIEKIGIISLNGFKFSECPLLNHDTLIRILNALYDYSDGDTHTITLGSTNLAKLTPEELAIGQNKNWTIS